MNPIHSLMKPNQPKTTAMQNSRNRKISLVLAGSIAALLATEPAHAATLYWDGGTVPGGDPAANANGGNGNWDNVLTNWDTLAIAGADAAWGANDTAVFGGTAGTVTLTDTINVGGLTFNTTAYNITTTGFSLNFAAANNTILFNNIAAATITGPVGGSGNVILSRSNPTTAGTLTLNGTSTDGWTGNHHQ